MDIAAQHRFQPRFRTQAVIWMIRVWCRYRTVEEDFLDQTGERIEIRPIENTGFRRVTCNPEFHHFPRAQAGEFQPVNCVTFTLITRSLPNFYRTGSEAQNSSTQVVMIFMV